MALRLRSANRQLIRQINQAVVLGVIHDRGPISRTAIAEASRLSLATISGITADLIAQDLIYEREAGVSTGGRRPILLALNRQAGLVLGAKLTESHIVAALTDLGAEIVAQRQIPLGPDRDPDSVVAALAGLVADLRAAHPDGRIFGLGLGLAGAIDRRAGICRFSPFLGWRDVPLRRMLESRLGLPVVVENDVNTLTVAEQWFGAGSGVQDVVVVTLGRGVGLGMIVAGQVYRGGRGSGGEFGHTTVDPDGPRCDCGKRGCLEAFVSEPALRRRIQQATQTAITLDQAITRARDGDDAIQAVFAAAGQTLGLALSGVVNLLNPTLLIVGGEGAHTLEPLLEPMRTTLEAHCFEGLFADLTLVVEPWGDDAWARGAAGLMLEELFHPTLYRDAGEDVATLAGVFAYGAHSTGDERLAAHSAAG